MIDDQQLRDAAWQALQELRRRLETATRELHQHEEIDVPAFSGKLTTLGYLSPKFYETVRPMLERKGAKNKAKYLAAKKG